MPWFDSLMSLMGSQDPRDELRQYSDQQQLQNRQAVGLDAAGNPLPAPPDAQGVPNGAAAAANASGIQSPQQEPNSTKTPLSIGHILMDLQQRDEAKQGWNQALGMGLSAFAHPAARHDVSQMFNVKLPDENQTIQTIMNASSNQQGQDRSNAVGQMVNDPVRLAALAKSLNMEPVAVQALGRSNPAGLADLLAKVGIPTPEMANLQQITRYSQQISSLPGANTADLASLKTLITANIAGPEAAQMVADQIKYRQTHNGQEAPWRDQPQAYRQWTKDQGEISANQTEASKNLSAGVNKTEMLRQKVGDLQNNPGLNKILALPNDSPMKQAAWNAVNDPDPNWQKNVTYSVLVNDPQVMQAVSELKEINGQEYTGAIDSLLGHGLRPSQTEVGAVREGFGQTKNLLNFSSMKDYKSQAIDPMLTRLDEAEATGYASSGELKSMPARLRPFTHRTYLTGGRMHLDDGAAPESWEGTVNKPMPPDLEAAARARIAQQPGNAFAIRDGLRRKGYVVDF